MAGVVQLCKKDAREGVAYARAMEVFERFCSGLEAVPTVAARMGIPFDLACRILDGKVWPAARAYWLDRVFE